MSREQEIRELESYIGHLEDLEAEVDECGDHDDLPGIANERESAEEELRCLKEVFLT